MDNIIDTITNPTSMENDKPRVFSYADIVKINTFTNSNTSFSSKSFSSNLNPNTNPNSNRILQLLNKIIKSNENKINDLEELIKFHLSLNISFDKNIELIQFGQIFDLIKGTIQSSKVIEDVNGDGIMITQSKNKDDYKKIKNWIIDGDNLFIGNIDSGKKIVINYYKGKCDYSNLLSLCKLKEEFQDKINIMMLVLKTKLR